LIAHKATVNKNEPAWNGILETSEALMDNMRDLLWVMDSGQTSLQTLDEKIREFARDYLQEFQIKLESRDDPELPEIMLNRLKSREIFLIAKESIHNIARHSGAEKANLSFSCTSEFCMEIADNGRGLDITSSKGRGMENIRSRARELGGKVEITNSETGGFRLLLKIPLPYLHESA
jgi:signal transduction histidine kinase